MSSLALYRALVPGHAAVLDATVETWLELAARRHSAAAFGTVYAEAMVWWAAHFVELTPGTGAGSSSGSTVGQILSQKDGDLSVTYANTTSSGGSGGTGDLTTTRYGQLYLDLRNSRAAMAPGVVGFL